MSLQQVSKIKQPLNPIALSVMLAVGVISLPTIAEENTAELTKEDKLAIEVVTVTARHKIESLQSTPIAVSAFNSDQIKEERITGLEDISGRVPGFQMNMYNSAEPELFMRGIGSDIESAGAGAAIGMYIDGVYISRGTGAAMDLYDLQSVEVLRGPQGTLYGKNVVGGAINFITKRPVDGEMEGSVEATMGDYGLMEAKGFVTGSLTDNVAGKIAISGITRDGYGENTYTGNDADDIQRTSARGQLLFTPSTNLEILVTAGVSNTEGTPRVKHIGYSAGRNAPYISDDPRKDLNSVDGYEDSENASGSVQVDWDLGSVRLTSITAYRQNDYEIFENAATGLVDDNHQFLNCNWDWSSDDFIPCDGNTVSSDAELAAIQVDDQWLSLKGEESTQVSQELRLAGIASDKFSWLAGAFYMKEDIERNESVDYWFHTGWGTSVGNKANGTSLGNTTQNITTSYAVFANGTYEITNKLSVTAGLRWSEDSKDFSGTAYGLRFDNWDGKHVDLEGNRVDDYAFETDDSWEEWTPSVNVDYQANNDLFFYGSISKGYKAGGFNGEGMEKAEEAMIAFLPEIAWNYETGFKLQALEDRLRLNGALFYTDYTDIQSAVWVETGENTPDNLTVINGSGRAQGIELEVIALLSENLTLSGSYGYLDSEFTDDLMVNDENLKGNKMRRTPEHSFNVSGSYVWDMSDIGEASVRLSYQYTSDYFFDNSNDPLTQVDAEFNLDAVIMLRSFDDTWSLQLWAKNLTDELNTASTTVYAAWDDTVFNAYKAPRTFGVSVSYRF